MKAALRTLVGMLLLFLLIGWALTADGQINSECDFHTNHSGYLPPQYDYGVFEEDDPPVHVVHEGSLDPEDYDAGSRWDRVWKCKYPDETTTTTSTPSSTTTTVIETTTTSTVPETTTTVQETTTTSEATTSTTEAPTTTVPEVTTTTVVVTTTTVPELPETGPGNVWLFPLGLVLAASGGYLVRRSRESA